MPLLLALIAVSGCSSTFETRLLAAETLRLQAAERGYEWLETADLLAQAKEAAERGDDHAALDLVARAHFQAEAALRQADDEDGAWERRVVR